MAEINDDQPKDIQSPTSSTNWWGSWISSAKSKSASVFEAIKQDLDEISTVVRTEVSNAGVVIGETLKLDDSESTANTVKKSLSQFFGQVSDALIPTFEDEETEAVLITSDGTVTLAGFQKHLAELQANSDTYLKRPDETLTENYNRWMDIIDQDQFTQDVLSKHLASSEILNGKYLSLVPEQVSHMEFWKRYLFKRALLEDALANAEIAERRSKTELESTQSISPRKAASIIQTEQPKKTIEDTDLQNDVKEAKENENLPWETNEDFGNIEISEEVQAQLLQEYEKEIQEREKRKSLIIPLEEKLKLNEEANKDKKISEQKSSKTKINVSKNENPSTSAKEKYTPLKNSPVNKKTSPTSSNQKGKALTDELNVEKNHFPKETPISSNSSNSDESWEKDFDLNDAPNP